MTDPKKSAGQLADELKTAAGDNLRGVLLYGSVARDEVIPGVSDVNVLVLLGDAAPERLNGIAALVRRWSKAGNTAPLVLGEAEWRDGADAFAIELADMNDAGVVLYGDDARSGLRVDPAALRLQAERELRGKLIQLRTGLMLSADEPSDAGRLLLTALPSFTTYLRAALRLGHGQVPATTDAVIDRGCALVGADPESLQRCWAARREKRWVKPGLHDPLVAGYYDAAERTVAYVDAFGEETHT